MASAKLIKFQRTTPRAKPRFRPQFRRARPQVFPLQKSSGRVGLLLGVIDGTVGREEIQAAVLQDTQKREYRKPVVVPRAFGGEVRFESVTEAAKYLLRHECGEDGVQLTGQAYARRLDCLQHRISRLCNADDTPHYYWAE
jgi:hypothetical protein